MGEACAGCLASVRQFWETIDQEESWVLLPVPEPEDLTRFRASVRTSTAPYRLCLAIYWTFWVIIDIVGSCKSA